jgi:Protein of unknown function (Hypoth_ymh)
LVGNQRRDVIRHLGLASEARNEFEASISADGSAVFANDAVVDVGDLLELKAAVLAGTRRKRVAGVVASADQVHVSWTDTDNSSPVSRLSLDGLHHAVVDAVGERFGQGHFTDAILRVCIALEQRVAEQSGLNETGAKLMRSATNGSAPLIDFANEAGSSGMPSAKASATFSLA